jgi:hypothetical protein
MRSRRPGQLPASDRRPLSILLGGNAAAHLRDC